MNNPANKSQISSLPAYNPKLYQQLKNRELQYITLIKDLHEQNHRLRQLLHQKEQQIQFYRNKCASPSKMPKVSFSPPKHSTSVSQRENVVFNGSNIFSPQGRNMVNFELRSNLSPCRNPQIIAHGRILNERNMQDVPTKQTERREVLPVFKPDQIFKNILKKSKEVQEEKNQQEKMICLDTDHNKNLYEKKAEKYLKKQDEVIEEKTQGRQSTEKNCQGSHFSGSKMSFNNEEIDVLKGVEKSISQEKSHNFKFNYGFNDTQTLSKETTQKSLPSQTLSPKKEARITNRIYL